jgi:N-acetylmuramoyl-L-alanine amidase
VTRLVLDPGHGGIVAAGRSTPLGARGAGGALEKDLTLDLARRVRARTPGTVLLTRDGDYNLSLAQRVRFAREMGADAFVSIHIGGAGGPRRLGAKPEAAAGAEVWVHRHAAPASRTLGTRLARGLGAATGAPVLGPLEGALAVLDPAWHSPEGPACLIELGTLGDPRGEARLLDPRYRDGIAGVISRAVSQPTHFEHHERREQFDIWHEVPMVQQLTGMSCWAAAAAMVVGWRDCIDIDPEEVARGAGRWQSYREGLEPNDVRSFARAWGLEVSCPSELSVPEIRRLLESYGPIWVGEASPGLHVVVVAGMRGDGTLDGTHVRIADPWPIGRGERYSITFREFQANLLAAASLAGGLPQILHAGPGARGTSRRSSSLIETSRSITTSGAPAGVW